MANDDERYEQALGRNRRMMLALAAGGALAYAVWRGWSWGAGFAAGAVAGWLNYRILKRMVNALGSPPAGPRGGGGNGRLPLPTARWWRVCYTTLYADQPAGRFGRIVVPAARSSWKSSLN